MNAKHLETTAICLLTLVLGTTACGLKDAFEDTKRTNAAIKAELGLDANTSWESTNGHAHVQVKLAAPPPGDAAIAKREIAAVVTRTFRSKIEQVDVEY